MNHNLNKLNSTLRKEALRHVPISLGKWFLRKFSRCFSIHSYDKFTPSPEDLELKKLESTLTDDASTRVIAFLAKWSKGYFKMFFLDIST